MKISGIYKITNIITKKFYIGSSSDIHQRWNEHRSLLNRKVHSNKKFIHAWHKYGIDNFMFEIIEIVDEEKLLEIEQKYLDILKPHHRKIGYNLNPTVGGGNVFAMLSSKCQNEIREKCALTGRGKFNPMFGKNHLPETIAKQKQKAKGRFSLPWFQEKYGNSLGLQKYNDRCLFLKNRKINYSHPKVDIKI